MSRMKDYLAIIHGGGDEAVEIAQQFMGLSDFTVQDDEPRWIPVSERVPEMGERVMVGHAKDGWVGMGERVLTGDYLHWEDDGEDLHEPTHWMPLPEPPEVK